MFESDKIHGYTWHTLKLTYPIHLPNLVTKLNRENNVLTSLLSLYCLNNLTLMTCNEQKSKQTINRQLAILCNKSMIDHQVISTELDVFHVMIGYPQLYLLSLSVLPTISILYCRLRGRLKTRWYVFTKTDSSHDAAREIPKRNLVFIRNTSNK